MGMMRALYRKLKSVFSGKWFKYAYFLPERTGACSHCGYEFPFSYLKKVEYPPQSCEFNEFFSDELMDPESASLKFHFYLCPVCVEICPKLNRAFLGHDLVVHYVWETPDGDLYEVYEFAEGNGINNDATNR